MKMERSTLFVELFTRPDFASGYLFFCNVNDSHCSGCIEMKTFPQLLIAVNNRSRLNNKRNFLLTVKLFFCCTFLKCLHYFKVFEKKILFIYFFRFTHNLFALYSFITINLIINIFNFFFPNIN